MYRIENEENGEKALVIDGFDKGIAPDPYSGTNYMLGVNLNTPGEFSVGYPITANTLGSGTLGIPIARSTRFFSSYLVGTWGTTGSPQSYAILDDTGQVWESNSGAFNATYSRLTSNATTTSASSDDGLAYFLGYLFKFRADKVDYWNGSTWSNAWQSTVVSPHGGGAGYKHFAYTSIDNVLYFTNGNYVGSIDPTNAATGVKDPFLFDPGTSSTYTYAADRVFTSANEVMLSLADIAGGTSGTTLLIGGSGNTIYPWDKRSESYGTPIFVADSYISLLVSANQNAFIFPGKTSAASTGGSSSRGRIYITNGSQANLYYKIPDHMFGEQDPLFEWGDAIYHRNNLLFGFFPVHNSGSSGFIQNFGYVWALDLETEVFRGVSQLTMGATFAANATVLISPPNVTSVGFGYIVGWTNNVVGQSPTVKSIGYSGTTAGVSAAGQCNVLTDLIPIGTFTQKKTFSQVEFKLRSPLASGESITITPYVDSQAQTNLTFSPSPTTGSISGYAPTTWTGGQWLQFIISTTGNSATSGVRFKELRVR